MFTQTQALILALERYSQLPADRLSSGDHLKNSRFYTLEFTNIKDVLSNSALEYYKNTCDRMDKFESCPDLDVIKSIVFDKENHTINENLITQFLNEQEQLNIDGIKTRITYRKHTWQECFEEVIRKVMENKQVRPGEIKSKRREIETLFNLAEVEHVEDFTPEKTEEVKQLLEKLPANGVTYYGRNVSLRTIIQRGERDHLRPISKSSVLKYLASGSFMYKCLIKKRYIYLGNPFTNVDMTMTKKEKKLEMESRYVPFSYYDLDCIFNPKNYFNCRAQPSLYFIPVISLCLGMRANECCQLTTNDIEFVKTKKGKTIYTIKIQENGLKRTKTCNSNRTVPIPKALEDCGFLDFVNKIKQIYKNQDVQLFRDMKLNSEGYFSSKLSDKFITYIRSLGISNHRKVFHSFRHTFRMNCAVNKISAEIANIVGGWSSASVGESYANAFDMEDLYNSLNSIPHLELKRLIEDYKKNPIF